MHVYKLTFYTQQEKDAEAMHDGKSTSHSSKSAAHRKTHDKRHPVSSPVVEKKDKVVSPKTVPQIGKVLRVQ